MRFLKVTLPITLAFLLAVAALVATFIPHHYSGNFINETTIWSRVIGGVTMFIGAYSLLRVHYFKIKRQQKGWGYSAVVYVFFALMVIFGIMNYGVEKKSGKFVGAAGPLKPATSQVQVQWLYRAVQWPAGSTQYSLLGFFICSAAYRTFRAKTVEAAVLLVAALIVMLGQVPIAALISEKIPMVSGWLLDVPNMAVKRAIMFGICAGSVATALRVMFGIERSYMGGD